MPEIVIFNGLIFDYDGDATDEVVQVRWNYTTTYADGSIKVYATEFAGSFAEIGGGLNYTGTVGNLSNFKFCDGTTLAEFRSITAFPYAVRENTANSPSCSVSVCDLTIQPPIAVTPESSVGAGDASVIITATSSNQPIEYSLDNVTFQSSNTFTGLSAGSYFAYVRDNNSCTDVLGFDIPEPAVYGKKYNADLVDTYGNAVNISIYKRNYTDSISELTLLSGSPVIHKINNFTDDKYTIIKPSELTLNLISQTNFEFSEFFTISDEFEYKLEVTKSGASYFTGYVVPAIYEEVFDSPPYYVNLTFVDGLTLLKDFEFLNPDNTKVQGTISLASILQICLNKLNLNLDIVEAVNIFEVNQSTDVVDTTTFNIDSSADNGGIVEIEIVGDVTGPSDATDAVNVGDFVKIVSSTYGTFQAEVTYVNFDNPNTTIRLDYPWNGTLGTATLTTRILAGSPLLQTYVDATIYEDSNCFEVIESILKIFGCRIFQFNSKWHIEQINEKYNATINRRTYNYLYEFQSSESYNPIKALTVASASDADRAVLVGNTANMQFLESVGRISIEQDFRTLRNIAIPNRFNEEDFNELGLLENFAGNTTYLKRPGDTDDTYSIGITGNATNKASAGYVFINCQKLNAGNPSFSNRLKISFKYKVRTIDTTTSGDVVKLYIQCDAYYSETEIVRLSKIFYNQFVTDSIAGDYDIDITQFDEFKTFTADCELFWSTDFLTGSFRDNFTGLIRLYFFQGIGTGVTVDEIQISDIQVNFLPNGDILPLTQTTNITSLNGARKPRELEVLGGDADNTVDSFDTVFRSGFKLQNGSNTQFWGRAGFTEAKPLVTILANNILNNFYNPTRVITGKVVGNLDFTQVITIPQINNGKFMVNAWERDLLNNEILTVELVQIFGDVTEIITDRVKLLETGDFKLLANGNLKLLYEA